MINQLANKARNLPSDTDVRPELTSIVVDSLPSATSSSHLVVSGTTVNFDIVEVYLNHEKVTEAMVVGDTFSEEISGLETGENTVYFIAKSKEDTVTKKSTKYTVIYKNQKPLLEISEPVDNSKTEKQEIRIAGKTDRETYVKISNQPVVVDAQGGFQTYYKLSEGENKIEIIAEDIVGNRESKTVTVHYSKED